VLKKARGKDYLMDRNYTIGLVQMESTTGDTQGNLGKIHSFAEDAAALGVDILCFPEMALHGYGPTQANKLAEPLTSVNVQKISEAAVNLGITLLVGMAEKQISVEKPYLTHLVAYKNGQIAAYRKTHLGQSEEEYFSPGQEFPVFRIQGICFGIGLCWDWHFPEVATIYSLKGAEVLFAPHASPTVIGDRKKLWMRYLGTRAYDNSVYLGACNVLGENGLGQEFQGGALVLSPKGEIISESFRQQEGILTCELSAEHINILRGCERKTMKEIFFLAHRRKELYREIVELDASQDQHSEDE